MKKFLISAVLFLSPMIASASVNINAVTTSPVEPWHTATVNVAVTRTLVGPLDPINATNDWASTAYRIDGGAFVCKNTTDFTIGNGTSTASFTFTATSTEGTYSLDVRVYALNACLVQQDSLTGVEHKVRVLPPPPPPSPVVSHVRKFLGGGLNCKAVGKVFVNDATGTGCRDAAPVLGNLPAPTQPACFYLNALANNHANYCVGTNADALWKLDSFRNAVLKLYNHQ